jgi:hypothetical protein
MAFLLDEALAGVGRGFAEKVGDAVGDVVNKKVLSVGEKLPIIGDALNGLVKGYNIASDEASDVVDGIFKEHDIPAEHKAGIMDRFKVDKAYKKLQDDLEFKDKEKEGTQRVVHRRPSTEPETGLKKKLFNGDDIRKNMLKPDGSIDIEKLEPHEQKLLKERINAETRHGFDLDKSRSKLLKGRSPTHMGTDFPKFSDLEKRNLLLSDIPDEPPIELQVEETTIPDIEEFESQEPEFEQLKETISPTKNELSDNARKELLDNIINNLEGDARVGDLGDTFMDEFLKSYKFINEDFIQPGNLGEFPNAPDTDDIAFKMYRNPEFKVPQQIIANAQTLSEDEIGDLRVYNSEVPLEDMVKSIQSIALDNMKNEEILPEIVNKLTTDGLKIEGVEDLTVNELDEFSEELNKQLTDDKIIEWKEPTTKPNVQSKPKILRRFKTPDDEGAPDIGEMPDSDKIDLDEIPGMGEKKTDSSSFLKEDRVNNLNNPPSQFKQFASDLLKGMSNLSESSKNKVMDFYNSMTWQQLATLGVTTGLTAGGFINSKLKADEIKDAISKMPEGLRESLGIDLGMFDTITSLSPTNLTLPGVIDTLTKLHKLTQQIPENAKAARDSIKIFNQPSGSMVTDNDNKRRMDRAEAKHFKSLEDAKKENEKLMKQLKIARVEEDRLINKKAEKEKEKEDKEDRVAEVKANQDAKRLKSIIGGDPMPSSTSDSDKSVNINIINDSSVPTIGNTSTNGTGILKSRPAQREEKHPLPPLIKKMEEEPGVIKTNGVLKKKIDSSFGKKVRKKL